MKLTEAKEVYDNLWGVYMPFVEYEGFFVIFTLRIIVILSFRVRVFPALRNVHKYRRNADLRWTV